MADYPTTLHAINTKIRAFERKYAQSWELFSKAVEAAPDEDFDKWDDYIEWKAYVKMAEDMER